MNSQDYIRVRELAARVLTTGQNLSLPIPVIMEGRKADVFFTHTVNFSDFTPNKPMGCLAVLSEEGRVLDLGDYFGFRDVDMEYIPYSYPPNYKEDINEAHEIYGDVRREVFGSGISTVSARYAELVKNTSQPGLLPFYEAISFELFQSFEGKR